MRRSLWMSVVAIMAVSSLAYGSDAVPLSLVKWLPVEGPARIEPSGLTLWEGELFTVSDKHDSTIFRIEIGKQAAVMTPAVKFDHDDASFFGRKLDLEGITCDEEGTFYLVSEARFQVLRVPHRGNKAVWVTPSLRECGRSKGMFRVQNASLEGIAHAGPNALVLCVERQPRGIIEVSLGGDGIAARAYTRDRSRFHFPEGRCPDFAGLFRDGDALYVIERNANLICQLIPGSDGYEEGPAWSFDNIVTRDELRYSTMRFGMAEGLCMDDDHVYVILDNNREARELWPMDRRPLLLVMKRPRSVKMIPLN